MTSKTTAELFTNIYDMLKERPRTFNEMYRVLKSRPQTIKFVLNSLMERHQADQLVFSPDMEKYIGELKFSPFTIYHWLDEKTLTPVIESQIEKEKENLITMSKVGFEASLMFEKTLGKTCTELFGQGGVETSAYESPTPDVLVPGRQATLEISSRYENPIDESYVWKKINISPFDNLHVIGIRFRSGVIRKVDADAYDIKVVIHHLPIKGNAIPSDFADTVPIFESHARKADVVSPDDLKDMLMTFLPFI